MLSFFELQFSKIQLKFQLLVCCGQFNSNPHSWIQRKPILHFWILLHHGRGVVSYCRGWGQRDIGDRNDSVTGTFPPRGTGNGLPWVVAVPQAIGVWNRTAVIPLRFIYQRTVPSLTFDKFLNRWNTVRGHEAGGAGTERWLEHRGGRDRKLLCRIWNGILIKPGAAMETGGESPHIL